MTATMPRSTITTPTDREIRVERVFNASRDRVWRAYTDPAQVAQWWGRGNKLVIEKLELVRGGIGATSSTRPMAKTGSRVATAR